jgi:hypothetical protein
MPTHRRYYFVHDGPWPVPGGHEKVLTELQDQCNRNWWYNNPEVHGEPVGVLEFRVTVSGEDQWRVHKRAMGLAETVYHRCGLTPDQIPTPMWEPLPPHTNRGYSRVM